ncbi:iron chelate uptake ABC transporter family permease subunit [Desulfovibrio aerotolerans]|uniref:Iron chelate uptake ABC transporter family permease subunit n=1 Tax=Solidesulfovibrio aerotolerans TaxID=295255 RepID=A0A7C9MZT3_9BACT|nr:iron ABC transporter permease [Solidesulfovibrio aerotolerans]MYL81851.1 iron chelate uptake ABC transporter family permease subunit [Solidesulfovibrio aerotolerans]
MIQTDRRPFPNGGIPEEYRRHLGRKLAFLLALAAALAVVLVATITVGAANVSLLDVARSLLGLAVPRQVEIIVWNIRLPQALACLLAGMGLAAAGTVMQSVLRNPLGSPFTLGLSHAAAFGAALAVIVLAGGTMTSKGAVTVSSPWLTTACAFASSMAAAGLILAISQRRGATPEAMVLAGVALGSLCTAATMLLQYVADDVQLAAMIFWTFGDASRASWRECGILAGVTLGALLFFYRNAWNYNAIDAGDETAKGLGVRVGRVRLTGMLVASLATATLVAFLGIIGFVGLVAPHLARLLLGGDHRFLLPGATLTGALLLLASDTAARLVLAPHVLPVSVLTAFLGAPIFLLLILRKPQQGRGR